MTEILVKEGDTVKKGDPMMTFDTTLSGLDLERKRLEVEKLKLELLDAEDQLKKIKAMKPMQLPPELPDSGNPNLGTELLNPYRISGKPGFDGSSKDAPLICWLRDGTDIDQTLVDAILETALNIRLNSAGSQNSAPSAEDTETQEAPEEPTPVPPQIIPPASRDNPRTGIVIADKLTFRTGPSYEAQVVREVVCSQALVTIYDQVDAEGNKWVFVSLGNGNIEGWVPMYGSIELVNGGGPVPTDPPVPVDPEPIKKVRVSFHCEPAEATVRLRRNDGSTSFSTAGRNVFLLDPGNYYYSAEADGYKPVYEKKLAVPSDADRMEVAVELEPLQDLTKLNSVYVVFKATEGNMSLGGRSLWQGVKLYQNGSFKFFDASAIPDYTMAASLDEEDQGPEFDMGSGMTAAQIADLRAEQEKKIDELELKVKMADAEYKIKKRELEDGNIYAEFDGKVVSLLTEEESRKMKKPMIKVSGGGGYQVEGSVNELDREKMKIGQKVTVNDWNSGESYEGKIISIGEFPIRSRGYNGRGNPNSSYYPFTAFVDGEANLQTGSYVSIQYAAGDSENGVYLSNPFIREEKGQSYVYVLGEDDRLEKRMVTTGKALWGSYTEITSGLTEEDYLAFPYGKNVKPGAKAKIGDMSDFYG